MKLIKKVIKVGYNSLMIILPKSICEKLKIKEGDYIKLNLKKIE